MLRIKIRLPRQATFPEQETLADEIRTLLESWWGPDSGPYRDTWEVETAGVDESSRNA